MIISKKNARIGPSNASQTFFGMRNKFLRVNRFSRFASKEAQFLAIYHKIASDFLLQLTNSHSSQNQSDAEGVTHNNHLDRTIKVYAVRQKYTRP